MIEDQWILQTLLDKIHMYKILHSTSGKGSFKM
jgi:hypothetical protein